MDIQKTIETRRSIRKYKVAPIPSGNLKTILEAARQAPSAGNKQPWGFIVVQDDESKKKIAEAARNQVWAADAGAIIVAFGDPVNSPGGYSKWMERDPMTAVEHMVLTAWSLGYGSCWIGAFEEDKVRPLVGLPDDKKIICLLPIGVPAESPEAKPRRSFSEVFHSEKYGQPFIL